jgi:hypothetical protein
MEVKYINISINRSSNSTEITCEKNIYNRDVFQYVEEGAEIVYTYDFIFYDSNRTWSSRWDHYLHSSRTENIHWLSIINSNIVIFIFSMLIGYILLRVLKKDIDLINSVNIFNEACNFR